MVTRRIPGPAIDRVRERCRLDHHDGNEALPHDDLLRRLRGVDGVLLTSSDRVDDELLEAAGPQLRMVSSFGVGYDHIDVPACTARSVMVGNTPDVLTEATAELTWALILAAARRVGEGDRLIRRGDPWPVGLAVMLGMGVEGKVLGVVGLGRIGRAVARRGRAFGMRIVYHNRHRAAAEVEEALAAEYRQLDELLGEADVVTLHTSLSEQTRHLIDAGRLGLMKPTAVLVNASRGPVIDETALVDALRNRRIFAAGLDVYESEPHVDPGLLELENVVLAPHIGSATIETRTAMSDLAAENLIEGVEGRRPPCLVNPEAWER
ncbi:MAG: 2-hydroxyacid dehydrogenase [Actinomycetota bacterium]